MHPLAGFEVIDFEAAFGESEDSARAAPPDPFAAHGTGIDDLQLAEANIHRAVGMPQHDNIGVSFLDHFLVDDARRTSI